MKGLQYRAYEMLIMRHYNKKTLEHFDIYNFFVTFASAICQKSS